MKEYPVPRFCNAYKIGGSQAEASVEYVDL